jgi:hypothetical protein
MSAREHLQITQWMPHDDHFMSAYGWVNAWEWLMAEQKRLMGAGISCQIVENSEFQKALIRNDRYEPEPKPIPGTPATHTTAEQPGVSTGAA